MKELLEQRKEYEKELMSTYTKKSNEFLEDVKKIFDCEQGFREYMKEKISVSSYQKGLNDFIDRTSQIAKELVDKKRNFNDLLNEFSLKDNEFSAQILTNTRKNVFDKSKVESELNKLEEEFNNEYGKLITDYTEKLDKEFDRIKRLVELNRKFVIEYGGLQLTNTPVENEYKPIYDKHDEIYDKFIFELQTEAYRINFLPQQIKATYSRVVKLLDENYDIFSDLLNDLND